jgi:hypothetical protein
MIGDQSTGNVDGLQITAVSHEGLRATFNGQRVYLAIVSEDGKVLASGAQVAKEAEAVAINSYRNFLKGQGHLRVLSNPLNLKKRAAA